MYKQIKYHQKVSFYLRNSVNFEIFFLYLKNYMHWKEIKTKRHIYEFVIEEAHAVFVYEVQRTYDIRNSKQIQLKKYVKMKKHWILVKKMLHSWNLKSLFKKIHINFIVNFKAFIILTVV